MSDDSDPPKLDFSKFKPKKKKLAVPEGFLEGAKSYEGKVEAIKIISEREKDKVVLMFKKMIAQGREDVIRIEKEKERVKKEADAKEVAEKKRQQELAKKSKSLFGKKK